MSTTPGDASERPVSDDAASGDAAHAAASQRPAETEQPAETETTHEVPMRRAPKYQAFLLIGVVVGLIAAMVLTFAFQRSPEDIDPSAGEVYFSPGQVFGFLLLLCIPIGVAIFGLLAVILDVRARRKTHSVRVDRVNVRVSETDAEEAADTAAPAADAEEPAPSPDKEDNQ